MAAARKAIDSVRPEPEWLPQPQVDGHIVAIGETHTGIDSVKQSVSRMTGGDPGSINVRDLVIDPDERPPRRPFDQGRSGFASAAHRSRPVA